MKEKTEFIIGGLIGLALLAFASFAQDILDAIIDGRPTELQVIAATTIPLGLGALLLAFLVREWRARHMLDR